MSGSKEIWKPVQGYEGLYEVSNIGRVKRDGKILAQCKGWNGYKVVSLCKNSKYKKMFIHRIVATAFIPNPNNLPCINHKDENKLNNNADNLEWCTYSYNINYGTAKERRVCSRRRPVIATVVATGREERYGSMCEAIRKLMFYPKTGNISAALKGKRKTAYGRTWQYAKEA